MDGQMGHGTMAQEIAGLIRSYHDGRCSSEPVGVRYPGVPSAAEICARIGVAPDAQITEDAWLDACDVIARD